MNAIRQARAAILAAIVPLLACACVVTAGTPPYVRHEHVIVVPPPTPRLEVIGVAPYPGYIWVGGYWTWHAPSHSHHWVPGRWSPPRHGQRWVPHRWERHGHGWREHPGHWVREDDGRKDRYGHGQRHY